MFNSAAGPDRFCHVCKQQGCRIRRMLHSMYTTNRLSHAKVGACIRTPNVHILRTTHMLCVEYGHQMLLLVFITVRDWSEAVSLCKYSKTYSDHHWQEFSHRQEPAVRLRDEQGHVNLDVSPAASLRRKKEPTRMLLSVLVKTFRAYTEQNCNRGSHLSTVACTLTSHLIGGTFIASSGCPR